MSKLEGGLRTQGHQRSSSPELQLVSVVTPVFNGEKHLEETILSVLNQDYDNIEYIIIDGGSTDGTQAILKKYDDRIDYWISEPDNGIYDAMNKGIRLAKGELVGIINSDDYYTAGAVKSVADEASSHPEAHVFHGNMEFQQTHGAKELWRPRKAFTKYGLYRMPVNHPTVFVRSSCYRECGVFDTRYRVAADYGLMLKFLLECGLKFHYIDSTLAVMRGGGASNRYTLDTLREVGAILKERRVPKTVLMRGMSFYLRLMFLQFFSGVWPLSYLFSLVRALRTRKNRRGLA